MALEKSKLTRAHLSSELNASFYPPNVVEHLSAFDTAHLLFMGLLLKNLLYLQTHNIHEPFLFDVL